MFLEGMVESSQWCLPEIVPYKSFMQQTIISWFDFPFPDHIFFSSMGGEVRRTGRPESFGKYYPAYSKYCVFFLLK